MKTCAQVSNSYNKEYMFSYFLSIDLLWLTAGDVDYLIRLELTISNLQVQLRNHLNTRGDIKLNILLTKD